eukprot:TRINITY_DN9529_c0_g1_i14.p1 TRINITY_DN9529_c0_g1~~TRINITY_DN9529_c0_g1_i14.p1  ORF type:complete len:260 (+),score=73.52 TRINITY_DN9529_c0_g1_i14:246-1025(+)
MRNDQFRDVGPNSTFSAPYDGFDLCSFSPPGVMMSCFQSQFAYDPASSSFALTLSKRWQNPLVGSAEKRLAANLSSFDNYLPLKSCENPIPSFDSTLTPIPKQAREGEMTGEGIRRSDIRYLRELTSEREKRWKQSKSRKVRKEGPFQCKCCEQSFSRSQALGGHMSRAHPGKSDEYKRKKNKRKSREIERLKLLIAKRKYFSNLGYDYDKLLETPEGKRRIQRQIDRVTIKKIKKELTKEEIDNFFEDRILDEIKEDA